MQRTLSQLPEENHNFTHAKPVESANRSDKSQIPHEDQNLLRENAIKFTDDTNKVKVVDGGCRAWSVCSASIYIFGLTLGFDLGYGLIYTELIKTYNNTENHIIYAGWIGSTAYSMESLFAFVSAICIGLFGTRKVAILGACLETVGFLSSIFITEIKLYFLTYSVLFGMGKGLIAEASLQILSHYFDKKLGLANGLMNFGGSLISMAFLIISDKSFLLLGLSKTFLIYTCISALAIVAATTFKSVLKPDRLGNEKVFKKIRNSFGVVILKKPEFIIWCLSSVVVEFGLVSTWCTIDHFANNVFPASDAARLNIAYTASYGVSSLVFGHFLDRSNFGRIYFHMLAFFLFGIAQIGLCLASNFPIFLAMYGVYGVGNGIYYGTLGSVACQVAGSAYLSNQAIGYLHLFLTIPVTLGPIAAAACFNIYGNYKLIYYLSAFFSFFACFIQLFYPNGFVSKLIRYFKKFTCV